MTPPNVPAWQSEMFAAVLQVAAEINAVAERGILLELMALLQPDQPQIAAAQAWVRLQQGDLSGARAMLEQADEKHPGSPTIKSLLAYCLFVQGDGLWQHYVRETVALPDNATALEVVKVVAAAAKVSFEGLDDAAHAPAATATMPMMGLAC